MNRSSTAFGGFFQKRAYKVHECDYHNSAKELEAKLGTPANATGPVEAEMGTYNSGRMSGFVVGAFEEVTTQVRDLTGAVNLGWAKLFLDRCRYLAEDPR